MRKIILPDGSLGFTNANMGYASNGCESSRSAEYRQNGFFVSLFDGKAWFLCLKFPNYSYEN